MVIPMLPRRRYTLARRNIINFLAAPFLAEPIINYKELT